MATAATDARPPLSTATNEQPITIVAAATTTILSTVSTAEVEDMPPSNHSPASSTGGGSPAVGSCGDTTASSPTAVLETTSSSAISKTGLSRSRQQQLTPPPPAPSSQPTSSTAAATATMGAAACTTATAATATSTSSSTATATTTPLRRGHHQPANNYAAPHTPIASAKRPSHSSRRSLGGGGGRSAAKAAAAGAGTAAAGGGGESRATHTPPPPPRPDDETNAEVLSPLHPPRPVKRDSHHVAGCPHQQQEGHGHMGGKEDEEGDDLDRSWVGRKVDAIFSPVLNFLGHGSHDGDEEEAAAKDGQEKAAEKDADGDVTMVDYCDDAGADSNQVVEASLAANATSTSTATMTTVATSTTSASSETDDVAATARATEQLYARYYDGHHHGDSASEGSNGDEEFSDEDDDDEEEFNPYLFMKSLPPYSSIDPAWTTRICLPPRQPGLAGRNSRAAAAAERARRRRVRPGDKKESNMSTTSSSSSSSSGVNTSTSSTDEASDALAYSSSGVSGKDESADDDDSNLISLVLDLDETLVHCTVEPIPNADLTFPVLFNGVEYSVHVKFRPHLYDFLNLIREDGRYEVIVFTASQQVYADELLDRIDPDKKYIHHRMFRESCLPIEGNYLKDLNVLGRDLRRAVLVDNSPHAFGYQVDNGIPIESWFDDPHDTELLKLERFLRTLHDTEDVRDLVRAKFQTRRLIMES